PCRPRRRPSRASGVPSFSGHWADFARRIDWLSRTATACSAPRARWPMRWDALAGPSSRAFRARSHVSAKSPVARWARMAERLDDRDLERTLSDIGTRLGGTKRDLWPAVRTRIAERRARPWWSRLSIERGALAPVAATLAVILVAALLLTPRVADALGNLLNLTGVQIYRVPQTPTARPTAPALTFAGQRVATAAEASRIAGFTVRTPAALGDPSAIYVETAPVRVTIVYASVKGIPTSPQA